MEDVNKMELQKQMELQKPLGQMEYKTIMHRFEYVAVHRLKDKTRMESAMKIQDRIREKTKGGKSLTDEIRRWRDKRCS